MKRKLILLPLLAALVVTGCSTNVEPAETETPQTEVVSEGTGSESVEENTAKETVEPYTVVDEAERETTFEKVPERIAVTYLPLWESLILLDVQPIGANGAENYMATWDAFEGRDLGEVVDLGAKEVNLELLTELEPDVILDQAYDLSSFDITNFEQISPVVVFGPKSKVDWRTNLREVAKVVNASEKAEAIISDVETKLADARVRLDEHYSDQTVMQMSLMAVDRFYILYRPDLYDKSTGLGLTPPQGFTTETNYTQITMEALAEMNPDVIFVNVFDGDEAMFEEFQQNPVWQNLTAVKNNNVHRLDGSGHALSALSTIHTVDEIVSTLLAE